MIGRRKRLKSSQLVGGESRGRVQTDEGVPKKEETAEPQLLEKAGSKSNSAARAISLKVSA